jgi:enterochelin esterase-like enzyme
MRKLLAVLFLCASAAAQNGSLKFEVSFPSSLASAPLNGRVLLAISRNDNPEPRFQIDEAEAKSQQLFGVQVDGLKPGGVAVVDASTLGYPVRSLKDLPAGDYYVQAVLNVYEAFRRSDGHVVELPPDRGEGQQWNRKPGNLYSRPTKVHVDPANGGVIRVELTDRIPPVAPLQDTKYVKHFQLQSKLLSEFWGRPMYLGAIVVLPEGFDEHPQAHYPLLVEEGHFPRDFTSFRAEPPAPDAKGRARAQQQSQYRLYQDWTSGRLPHVILLLIQHANPYYDDSYAVNSANLGPYGDAIVKELIPEVERRYRGIGESWARGQFGGSTGGWEVLAQQVFYPDEYNWTYSMCPDPIDFHAYQIVNIYDDKNAFWEEGPFGRVPRPEMRDSMGLVEAEMEPAVRREEVIGTKGRSAEQFAIWQAVFSPVGDDGYPKPIWDVNTGVINKDVAQYWQEHFDLDYIMQRDWATLGPKLAGKLHFTAGDMDTWYLNNAVRMFQQFHDSPKNPYRVADFEYGWREPHCYTGGNGLPPEERRAAFLQRMVTQFADRVDKTAPKDADVSWKY